MTDISGQQYTEADLAIARTDVQRGLRGVVVGLVGLLGLVGLASGAVAAALAGGRVALTALLCGAVSVAVGAPILTLSKPFTVRRGLQIGLKKVAQGRLMEAEARRRDFETRLSRALEMSGDESAACETIERAIRAAAPDAAVELLLADNSHAHLDRVVTAAPDGRDPPSCPVRSPDECVAARRAQTQIFADSEELDACPLLRNRPEGACSAVCVPVSIMGRTVGVLHATGPVGSGPEAESVAAFQVLATQAGNRLGMLRIMVETQLQASTDGLTGLTNRRSFENRVRSLRNAGTSHALVLADLDHFKQLNDTHGHEAGDRALRVFAETLREQVRDDDLACRYGGEEFIVLLPRVPTHEAIEVIDRVREALRQVTHGGDVPTFTASFGIAHSDDASDLEDLVLRADRALFAAKDAGRDCICIDGHSVAVTPNLTAIS